MNSTGQVPAPDADVLIDGVVTVNISTSVTTGSIQLSGGATLVVGTNGVLTTQEGGLDGSHGIRLDLEVGSVANGNYSGAFSGMSKSCALIVYGTININVAAATNLRAPKAGLYIGGSNSVTVYGNGRVNIIVASTNGIEIEGSLSNFGDIGISDPVENGIKFRGGGTIVNETSGTITIFGGVDCILFRTSTSFVNNGLVALSGATNKLIEGGSGWSFTNNDRFQGAGVVNAAYFTNSPYSTLIPGFSPGTLTFDNGSNPVDLSNVTLQVEIEGTIPCDQYDQIEFSGSGMVTLANTSISLSNTYTPQIGDSFNFVSGSNIDGDLSGGPYFFNSVEFNLTSGTLSSQAVLPVELATFTARSIGKAVQLHWTTATETNNDYFSIEHSIDGRHFKEIGRVSGFGTTQEEHRYTFIDETPNTGMNYYRLNQNDFDGAQEYSDIQAVLFKDDNFWTIHPTLAHESVTAEWVSAPGGESIIEAFNLAGQKVYAHEAPTQSAKLQIWVEDWLPGIYWVMVRSRGQVTTQRFVKE
ncbi:MAG: T9SS type A sorting domain-containing protein [Phaeodactylibacter sp.]|nr:T9SS type A sorting domain-containing protein [Phaeodactylibacter sp.]